MSNSLAVLSKTPSKAKYKKDLEVNAMLTSGMFVSAPMIRIDAKNQEFGIWKSGVKIKSFKEVLGVIIAAGPKAKRYYEGLYDPKVASAPDCASVDGITPDNTIECPQSKLCKGCAKNTWGSKGKGMACADYRRVIVCILDDYTNPALDTYQLYRLDIPPASLTALAAYSDLLTMYGRPLFSVLTRFGFDCDSKYTKLTFEAELEISEELYDGVITTARKDPLVESTINVITSEHAPIDDLQSKDSLDAREEVVSQETNEMPQAKVTKTIKVPRPKGPVKAPIEFNGDELNAEIDELTKD